MTNQLLKYVIACFSTVVLILSFKRLAVHVGLVDSPGGRKQHAGEIPLVGGPAMYLAFAFGALILVPYLFPYRSLFAALGVLVIVGVLDDMHDLTPAQKFLAQVFAAILMTSWSGMYVSQLGDLFGLGPVLLRDWAIPFTVVCALGVINALNMVDGMDGLAGGLAFVAFLWFGIAALVVGLNIPAQLAFLFASVLAGFLIFNMRHPWRERASIFMGNSGSMMLGLALTWFSVELSQGPRRSGLPPIVAVWILALPLFDMGSIMLRRIIRGRSPFSADREHLHHILLARSGYSEGRVVWILLSAAMLLGAIGFTAWHLRVPDYILLYTFIALFGLYYYAVYHPGKLMGFIKRSSRRV